MAKTAKKEEAPTGHNQYKKILLSYEGIKQQMQQLDASYESLKVQGVNHEGQMLSLREAFDIDHEQMVMELGQDRMNSTAKN